VNARSTDGENPLNAADGEKAIEKLDELIIQTR